MIDIEFRGITSKKRKHIFEQAANFFLNNLLKNKVPAMCLDIEVQKNLGVLGFCMVQENNYLIIQLDWMQTFEEQLLTLAHESVHCKQYLKRELEMRQGGVYWKKTPVKLEYIDFINSPWEKEAYSLEKKLYESFRYNELYRPSIEKLVKQEEKKRIKNISMLFNIPVD